MTLITDVVTYLEMRIKPTAPPEPAPCRQAGADPGGEITVSYYRYLYETVGTPWLWFERRLLDDATLSAQIAKAAPRFSCSMSAAYPPAISNSTRRRRTRPNCAISA